MTDGVIFFAFLSLLCIAGFFLWLDDRISTLESRIEKLERDLRKDK